jgi:ferredoxin
MPPKYHIHAAPVPNRFPPITRSGVIAWEEGCLKCARCVKKDCVYKVYEKRGLDVDQMTESLDFACKDCFRCVQDCPKGLIHKSLDPTYKSLGDDYWTPDIISKLWYQAETGKIPVSGAGYGGPFSGEGFDAMWTDMSEIVRPTRDGIHGREYIGTAVDLGRKSMALTFDDAGELLSPTHPMVEIPLPVVFDLLPWSPPRGLINQAILEGARALGTFAIISQGDWGPGLDPYQEQVMVHLDGRPDALPPWLTHGPWLVEIPDGPDALSRQGRLKELNPDLVVVIRLPFSRRAPRRANDLARSGAEVLHLCADPKGREEGDSPRFIKECMKDVHFHLIEAGLRDGITLLAGGGVAMAEHMAKLIICGADAVTVDVPLLVAMECRVCRRCEEGLPCPVKLEEVNPRWGGARIRNLMAGWHSQLLEVMGAMGLRDVRRLRGEMGRAMFFEDLERDFFASLGRRG